MQVIDTSDLVKDDKDVFSTSKTACILRDSESFSMIISSPAGSILRKLYEKTRLRPDPVKERETLGSDRCLITRDPFQVTNLGKLNVFFVGEKKLADFGFASSSLEGIDYKFWVSKKPIHEYNHVIYHSPYKPTIGRM